MYGLFQKMYFQMESTFDCESTTLMSGKCLIKGDQVFEFHKSSCL